MEAWIDCIDLKISHKNAKRMMDEMKHLGVAENAESPKDYLARNFCEVASDRGHLVIKNIDMDGYDQGLYAFLERLETYVKDGGLIRFMDEAGGWSVALYEGGKLRVHGVLAMYREPKREIEIAKQMGNRGYDGNTYVYDESPTEDKLKSFWYWRNGCLRMALTACSLGEDLASLKGINKEIIETLHRLSGNSIEILAGKSSLTKDDVNSFAKYAPLVSERLAGVVSQIESRPDSDDLLILKGYYQ